MCWSAERTLKVARVRDDNGALLELVQRGRHAGLALLSFTPGKLTKQQWIERSIWVGKIGLRAPPLPPRLSLDFHSFNKNC